MSRRFITDIRDKNHPEIVAHLRSYGYEVIETYRPLDILISDGKRAGWIEIKVAGKGGEVNRGQLQFMSMTKMPVAFAISKEEALEFARTFKGITQKQKEEIQVFLSVAQAKAFTPKAIQDILGGKWRDVIKRQKSIVHTDKNCGIK